MFTSMARALRIEYEGARYHVMGRGNQSRDIFLSQADADLFLKTLGEVCRRNQMVVHAWCLMSNHYHMLVETPLGNLVDAMKWFQGTFTQRYNARHKLWGHLFQGRYKAKIIDDADASHFRVVSEYIHLNPADAGVVEPGHLADYPWSSYPFYLKPPSRRPDWLEVVAVLESCGMARDTPASRRAYAAYMDLRHQSLAMDGMGAEEKAAWRHMERGWVHGSREFRGKLRECLLDRGGRAEELEQKRDLGEAAATETLEKCLVHFKLDPSDLPRLAKSDARKLLIAGLLRYHYPVRAQWVGDQLEMGHFTTVSRAMKFYDEPGEVWGREKERILKFIG